MPGEGWRIVAGMYPSDGAAIHAIPAEFVRRRAFIDVTITARCGK
jgi:hypothetical protein